MTVSFNDTHWKGGRECCWSWMLKKCFIACWNYIWNFLMFYYTWTMQLVAFTSFRLPKVILLCPPGFWYCFNLGPHFIIFLLIIKYHRAGGPPYACWTNKFMAFFMSGSLAFPDTLLLWIFETFQFQTINVIWLLFSDG